jgi:protocatechuate 4,5-dioxygenase beta chain
MDRTTIETAIRRLAEDRDLLARFKADPTGVGAELGLTAKVADAIATGDRGALRSLGVDSGLTILVGRWFGDSAKDTTRDTRFRVDDSTVVPPADVPPGLVFAGGCSHVPDFLARPEIDPPDQIERLAAGFRRLRARLAAARPDVLVATADNHFQSFRTGAYVAGTGARHTGSMAFFKRPDLDLTVPGDPAFARSIVDAARGAGLEIEEAPRIDLDHGLIVPLREVLPRPDLPVVPLLTQPARTFSPFGARALGEVLRDVVRSSRRRVAMLATGGLSHWLDPGKFGFVDVEFDTYLLDMIRAGRGPEVGNLEPLPLLEHGQYEFPNWLIMLGLVGPGVRGEVFAYEPMTASGGGWTVVEMQLP